MSTVSVIIPIFQLQNERLRNFQFNLERFKSSDVSEIIVAEQVTKPKPPLEGVKHIQVQSDQPVIEKSRLINQAASVASGDYIWMNDADVYSPFQEILPLIKDRVFIKPFGYFISLTEKQTNDFVTSKQSKIDKRPINNTLGAGAFIMQTDKFKYVRGMDERYVGWGFEDIEFGRRANAMFPVKVFRQFQGIHLYHPGLKGNFHQEFSGKNKSIYLKSLSTVDNPVAQIANVVSPFEMDEVLSEQHKSFMEKHINTKQ